MNRFSIFIVCASLELVLCNEPQIYEKIDDEVQSPRVARHLYVPPKFQYKTVNQQDLRQARYLQQQQSDMKTMLNNSTKLERRTEYDINALNALIGQDPSLQLQGLQKLLQSPQATIVLPPIKGPLPRPIKEEHIDVPNPNTHPNVRIEALQSQLDKAAEAQLAKALAQAQKEALAQVQAQHQALAKAREEAHKKMAEIARHNQLIKVEEAKKSAIGEARRQAVEASKVSDEARRKAVEEARRKAVEEAKRKVVEEARRNAAEDARRRAADEANRRAVEQARRNSIQEARKKAVEDAKENTQKKTVEGAQSELLPKPLALIGLPVPNKGLKKISVTKTHTVTHHQSPQSYQEMNLDAQESQRTVSGVNHLLPEDEHQYAARYAFGYKIRDVKMGNEFGHEEKRDGENAKGLYHVLLPDGRMQKVEYVADDKGYHAKVSYQKMDQS